MSIYGSTFTLDDFEEDDLGPPYIYAGSHRTANPDMRGGSFDFAEVVPWCSEYPYLRVGITEAAHSRAYADVLIDVEQARALANYLLDYVERVDSGEWHEWGAIELEDYVDGPIDEYLRGYEARPSDLNRLAEMRKRSA